MEAPQVGTASTAKIILINGFHGICNRNRLLLFCHKGSIRTRDGNVDQCDAEIVLLLLTVLCPGCTSAVSIISKG